MGVWLWGVPLYTTLPSCPVITLARHFNSLFDRKFSSQRQYDLSCRVWSLWYAKPRPSYSLYPRPVFTTTTSWTAKSILTTRCTHHKYTSPFTVSVWMTHTALGRAHKAQLQFHVGLRNTVLFTSDDVSLLFQPREGLTEHGAFYPKQYVICTQVGSV
jgi:hypothetical protein